MASCVLVTILPKGTSGRFTVLGLPLNNLVRCPVALENERFVMSLMEKKIEIASKSPILGQLSPPATASSQKTCEERASQMNVCCFLLLSL